MTETSKNYSREQKSYKLHSQTTIKQIYKRNIAKRPSNVWKLNIMVLNNCCVKEIPK